MIAWSFLICVLDREKFVCSSEIWMSNSGVFEDITFWLSLVCTILPVVEKLSKYS